MNTPPVTLLALLLGCSPLLFVLAKSSPPTTSCVHIENVAYRRFLFPAEPIPPNYGKLPADRPVYYDNWDWLAPGSRNWTLEKVDKHYQIFAGANPKVYLYLNENGQFDAERRPVFAGAAPQVHLGQRALWKLDQQKNGYYTIRNEALKEYLYAGERKFDVSYECRRPGWNGGHWGMSRCRSVGQVFSWKGKKPKNMGLEYQWAVTSC